MANAPTRRQFLGWMGGALTAVSTTAIGAAPRRLPIGFSTLGCPRWGWKTVLERAAEWGYAAIELRGLEGEMDLTKRAEFSPSRIRESLEELKAHSLKISDLGASARMHEPEGAKRAVQIDEAKRFIDLAHRLGTPYVRVFGDKFLEGESKQTTIDRIVDGLKDLGRHARGSGVSVLIESHGDFTDSPSLLKILKGADMPEVGLLWDAHHTVVSGKESPAFTFAQLGPYVRHTHLKDSRPDGEGVRYVLTGAGTVPVRETVRVLAAGGYRGYYSFEWEKAWHPEIEEPEVAIPDFALKVGEYLAAAGVTA